MQGKLIGAGLACAVLLAGCGDINVKKYLPFGGDQIQERSRTPANATEYQCAAGKRIYVRTLEGGAAVWLILPERELRLDRLGADSSTRYGKGNTVLEITGNVATVRDGVTVPFADCKTGGSEPPPAARP
ncbi:MAG: MliC family protein [Rhodocyclales bacterium]|jgi:membrane-bound inhibitor of C-type lysozyme|nr:MliC family protein [Rhodocyclales bacterium]